MSFENAERDHSKNGISRANPKAKKKAVVITDNHLGAGGERKNVSDKLVPGFVLRTAPDTFYFQYLNKGTAKREWYRIGTPPDWTVERARNEARGLAGMVAQDGDLRQVRRQKDQQISANGVTFQQLHDAYIADCKKVIPRPWGLVPQKESWEQIEYALVRPLEWWAKRAANSITKHDIKELYASFVDEGHIPQANRIRTMLHTMFHWGATEKEWIDLNPCASLPAKLEAPSSREDGRVLTADEIRTFWFGVDDPNCPGDRLSKLALKLSLTTLLRTGECVKIERTGVAHAAVTIPLKAVKSRRSKKARAVVQPLNSLAREILGEVFSTPDHDPERQYAFPASPNVRDDRGHVEQRSLGSLLRRRTTDKNGRLGICEYLGLVDVTPHDLRRTGACILEQLGYDDGLIGKVMTHKTTGKEASPVTREHYLVPVQIIARPVDPRIKALNDLDDALREILDLPRGSANELAAPPRLLTAA